MFTLLLFDVLRERKVAVEALSTVETALRAARPALKDRLASHTDVPEYHQLDAFYQTVQAGGDIAVLQRPCHVHHS